jgi:hypothetical protein
MWQKKKQLKYETTSRTEKRKNKDNNNVKSLKREKQNMRIK